MEKNLTAVVVPNDYLEQLKGTLEKIEGCITKERENSPMWMWVKSEDARQMFGLSRKTWQTWRDKKYIPFSQFGQKIYYHLDDLNNFMVEHKIQSN